MPSQYRAPASDAELVGVDGVALPEVRIGRGGHTTEGRGLRPVDRRLDATALDAVLRWRFTPAIVEGRAVPVVLTVSFTLQQSRA